MTREEAILLLHDIKDTYNEIYENYEIGYEQMTALDMAIEALSERTGEWIYSTKQLEIVPMWECSCCRIRAAKKFNFCPHCGADMRGEQDG